MSKGIHYCIAVLFLVDRRNMGTIARAFHSFHYIESSSIRDDVRLANRKEILDRLRLQESVFKENRM